MQMVKFAGAVLAGGGGDGIFEASLSLLLRRLSWIPGGFIHLLFYSDFFRLYNLLRGSMLSLIRLLFKVSHILRRLRHFDQIQHFRESLAILQTNTISEVKSYLSNSVVGSLSEWKAFPSQVICFRSLQIDDFFIARSAVHSTLFCEH